MSDEEFSREAWLAHESRVVETTKARLKKERAKTVDNTEKWKDVPKRGLPVIVEQDPEEAVKKANAACCILCGREHHIKIVPLNSVAGPLYTALCLRCKSMKGWYRMAASVGLNLFQARTCAARIKTRRAMWKSILEASDSDRQRSGK